MCAGCRIPKFAFFLVLGLCCEKRVKLKNIGWLSPPSFSVHVVTLRTTRLHAFIFSQQERERERERERVSMWLRGGRLCARHPRWHIGTRVKRAKTVSSSIPINHAHSHVVSQLTTRVRTLIDFLLWSQVLAFCRARRAQHRNCNHAVLRKTLLVTVWKAVSCATSARWSL